MHATKMSGMPELPRQRADSVMRVERQLPLRPRPTGEWVTVPVSGGMENGSRRNRVWVPVNP